MEFHQLHRDQQTGTASRGVNLKAGGTITNTVGALIGGVLNGVNIGGASGLDTNLELPADRSPRLVLDRNVLNAIRTRAWLSPYQARPYPTGQH
jgi:hypothetical protein